MQEERSNSRLIRQDGTSSAPAFAWARPPLLPPQGDGRLQLRVRGSWQRAEQQPKLRRHPHSAASSAAAPCLCREGAGQEDRAAGQRDRQRCLTRPSTCRPPQPQPNRQDCPRRHSARRGRVRTWAAAGPTRVSTRPMRPLPRGPTLGRGGWPREQHPSLQSPRCWGRSGTWQRALASRVATCAGKCHEPKPRASCVCWRLRGGCGSDGVSGGDGGGGGGGGGGG